MDEREQLPSNSQLEAMALCPKRFQLGLQVPEPPASPEAQYGNQVHAIMETGEVENLTDDQRDIAGAMKAQEDKLVLEIFGKQIPAAEYREKRFWYRRFVPGKTYLTRIFEESIPEKLFSGKLDYSSWAHGPERVSLYIDYKSLWGDVTPPAHNLQLRGGAVLMKQNFGSRRAFVAICQPTKRNIAIAAEYGPAELEQAEQEIVKIVECAMSLDAQAVPGPEQCRYCRAKLICKVAHKESVEFLATGPDRLARHVGPDLATEIKYVEERDLDRLGAAWEVAQIIGKAIDAEIRRRKEADAESMPNYHFVPSGHTSEISNPAAVWPKFQHLLSREDFSAVCKVSKGELEKTVHAATGLPMTECKRMVEKLLGNLLVKKPKKPSLERKPYYEIK